MAATAPRKLAVASGAALGGFVSGPGGDAVPWDVVASRLVELLRFLASALQALAGELQDRAAALAGWARAAALPAALTVTTAVLLFVCCCGCCAGVGRRRRRGPDGEEVGGGSTDGPVVRYRRGGGWIFSMHPDKPIVC